MAYHMSVTAGFLQAPPREPMRGVSSRICRVQRAQSQLMISAVKLEHSLSFSPPLSSCSNSEENLVGAVGVVGRGDCSGEKLNSHSAPSSSLEEVRETDFSTEWRLKTFEFLIWVMYGDCRNFYYVGMASKVMRPAHIFIQWREGRGPLIPSFKRTVGEF